MGETKKRLLDPKSKQSYQSLCGREIHECPADNNPKIGNNSRTQRIDHHLYIA